MIAEKHRRNTVVSRWERHDTAREFSTSALAYFWAKEQKLLNTPILLAFTDPRLDIACMTVL